MWSELIKYFKFDKVSKLKKHDKKYTLKYSKKYIEAI